MLQAIAVFKNELAGNPISLEHLDEEKSMQEWFDKFEEYMKKNKWKNYVSYTDVDGKKYFAKLNLFGKIVDKYYIGDMPHTTCISIVKARCHSCGKEIIIFDNRLHGYDAFATRCEQDYSYDGIQYAQRKFKGSHDNLVQLDIKIFNDATLVDFVERTGEQATESDYSNAFSDITIYGKVQDLGGKKITIFSYETA